MAKLSKKRANVVQKVQPDKKYSLTEALDLIKECASANFVESVDISVNLGIDTKKSDQMVRGAVDLPNGLGKTIRVAVFTKGDNQQKALDAGADAVGMEDLMKTMQDGDLNYDAVIASPDAMPVVGRLGQLLGPRGLMPNLKLGTINADIASAVKKAKAGQVRYRADKSGIIHANIGKVSFNSQQLLENVKALIDALKKTKPTSSKGTYIKKLSLSSTMGIGIEVDLSTLN